MEVSLAAAVPSPIVPVLAMGWYAIFLLVTLPLLGIGWVAYIIWDRKMQAQEEEERKKGSKHLQKSRGEVSDWAKQMSSFKKPERKPPPPPSPH